MSLKISLPLPDGTYFQQLEERHLIDWLRATSKINSQKQLAVELGISPQYLSDILKERRPLPDSVAEKLGYEKRVTYIKWNGVKS